MCLPTLWLVMFVGRTALLTLSSRCPVFLLAEVAAHEKPVARKLVPLLTVVFTHVHANEPKNEKENSPKKGANV